MSKVFLPWLAGGIKYSLRGCEKLCPGWLERGIISQPVWAEFYTPSQRIFFPPSNQPGQSFYTPSLRLFYSSFTTSQGRAFTHPIKEYFFLLPISQGRAFTHPLKEYFYNLNWNVKRTNDQAFRLSSRNDLAVEIRSQISDSHIPGQLLSNGQMSLTN